VARKTTVVKRQKKEVALLSTLTAKQQAFVLALLTSPTWDYADAARAAGYANASEGSIVAKHPAVHKILTRLRNERVERAKVTSDRILQEVDTLALSDPIDLCDVNGLVIVSDLRLLPERMRRCIKSMKIKRYSDAEGNERQEIHLELHPKVQALELSMRHRGMLNDKVKVDSTVSVDWDNLLQEPESSPNVIDVTPDNMRRLVDAAEPKYSIHPIHDPQPNGDDRYRVDDLIGEGDDDS